MRRRHRLALPCYTVLTALHPLTRYVDVTSRAPNLACYRRRGLYQYPQPEHVALHYIKMAEGMQLAWKVCAHGSGSMVATL